MREGKERREGGKGRRGGATETRTTKNVHQATRTPTRRAAAPQYKKPKKSTPHHENNTPPIENKSLWVCKIFTCSHI